VVGAGKSTLWRGGYGRSRCPDADVEGGVPARNDSLEARQEADLALGEEFGVVEAPPAAFEEFALGRGGSLLELTDPKAGIEVAVMQRLHERDLANHLLERGGFTHLCLPARYRCHHPFVWRDDPRSNEGELLWPAHIPEPELARIEQTMGSFRAAVAAPVRSPSIFSSRNAIKSKRRSSRPTPQASAMATGVFG
jgi:hypothetical protein